MAEPYFLDGKYKEWMRELKEHWFLIFISIVLIILAAVINYAAGYYVTYKADVGHVSDLILDHFGPYNLSFIFVYFYLFVIFVYVIYPFFYQVKKLHKAIAQLSFLVILRAMFVILTHLKTPIDAVSGNFPGVLNLFKFSNDEFFSGHVAIVFLGYYVFSENKKLRVFFLISSIVMAITVLAMHQHYSIDVFAAFFMTYGCYNLGEWLMKKLKL